MKRIIIAAVVGLVVALASSTQEASADVGGCYSLQPLCMPGQAALCMCDQIRANCFWVCK